MTLFEPPEPNDRPPLNSTTFERKMRLLIVGGAIAALVGVIYLVAFLNG
jgi:hypothetical protein